MKPKTIITLITLLIFFATVSCDRPNCKNKNPIFDSHAINSAEYKAELLREIEKQGQENLTYWFSDYTEQNGGEYIVVNIQNHSLCAKGMIRINDWQKLEGIKRTKGLGYVGALLKGFTFDMRKEAGHIEFVYKDIDRIVD